MALRSFHVPNEQAWHALRMEDVTASQIGALLGVHDYCSAYEIWALKTGRLAASGEETPAMLRGRLLEDDALQLLAEKRPGWVIKPNTIPGGRYWRDEEARIGGTPDARAICPERGPGVVQVKSVEPGIFRQKWIDAETGEVRPPVWIACQAMIEAYLTQAEWACVTPLVVGHGIELEVIEVPIHAGLIGRFKRAVAEFWQLVARDQAPPPDFARDGDLLARLMPQDNGAEIDLSGDNELAVALAERARLKAIAKDADKALESLDAMIRFKVGMAQVALCGSFRISLKSYERGAYTVEAATLRPLRVSEPKAKPAAKSPHTQKAA